MNDYHIVPLGKIFIQNTLMYQCREYKYDADSDNGYPYIHDILTNHTDKTITETQYCMLAYDKNGSPLKLFWNFLDSSAQSSFENIVQSSENILPAHTEQYRGGWSLYDGEKMTDFPQIGDGGANQAAYILIC